MEVFEERPAFALRSQGINKGQKFIYSLARPIPRVLRIRHDCFHIRRPQAEAAY